MGWDESARAALCHGRPEALDRVVLDEVLTAPRHRAAGRVPLVPGRVRNDDVTTLWSAAGRWRALNPSGGGGARRTG